MYNIPDMMEIIKAILSAEVLTILAIVVGPVAAVLVARIHDKNNEEKERKLQIFRILFFTRAESLSRDHVAALNRIDLEFKNQGKDKAVINAWKEYLDHLGLGARIPDHAHIFQHEQWYTKCQELHVNLLYEMGRVVGYDFDKTHIKNSAYSPQLYGNTEKEQTQLRRLLLEVLEGKRPIPLEEFSRAPTEEQPPHSPRK